MISMRLRNLSIAVVAVAAVSACVPVTTGGYNDSYYDPYDPYRGTIYRPDVYSDGYYRSSDGRIFSTRRDRDVYQQQLNQRYRADERYRDRDQRRRESIAERRRREAEEAERDRRQREWDERERRRREIEERERRREARDRNRVWDPADDRRRREALERERREAEERDRREARERDRREASERERRREAEEAERRRRDDRYRDRDRELSEEQIRRRNERAADSFTRGRPLPEGWTVMQKDGQTVYMDEEGRIRSDY